MEPKLTYSKKVRDAEQKPLPSTKAGAYKNVAVRFRL